MNYKCQCKLERCDEHAKMYTVTWVDEKTATVGKFVGCLSRQWKIVWVSRVRVLSETVNDRSRDYLRTRKASDV